MITISLKQNKQKKAVEWVTKIIISICLLMASLQQVKAQFVNDTKPYTAAIGARYPYAISSRFINGLDALETFISFSPDYTRLTCLYELNKKLSENISAFAGAGGHIIVWKETWKVKHNYYDTDIALGFDAVIGIDYKIENLPVDVSVDWQPYVNAYGYKQVNFLNGGINLRFAF